MKFRVFSVFSVVAITTVLAPVVAGAACRQGDIAGNWQATSSGYGGGRHYRAQCTFKVGNGGAISGSRCSNTQGQSGSVSNARLVLAKARDCTYRGSFIWFNTLHELNQLTLASDKRTGSGTGTFANGHFTFEMTRGGR